LIVAEPEAEKLPANPELAAFFFRLAADGKRLTDIRYSTAQD
jgi:hypothetical protein